MSLREDIRYRLDSLMVPDMREKLDHTLGRIAHAKRRRDEVEQKIPFWDRVNVFTDTPDEELVDQLTAEIEAAEEDRERLEAELAAATAKVGEEFPPYGLLLEVARCLKLARRDLGTEGVFWKDVEGREELRQAFDALADRVIEVWVPDLDHERLFAALATEDACKDAAEDARAVDPHRRLGVEPTTNRRLLGPMAAKLLASDFFAEQENLRTLQRRVAELTKEHEEARGAVTLGEKLNVFSDSPAEQRRDSLSEELDATRDAARTSYETTRRLLHEALGAFPPLQVYQRIVEAMGVTSALEASAESLLAKNGALTSREVVAGRALVYAALRGVLEACDQAFPDVPLPAGLASLTTPPKDPKRRSPLEELTARFQVQLEGGWAPGIRAQALGHATMCGAIDERLERVRGQISLFDRLVFFVDTVEEQQEDELQAREAWHRAEARARWKDLLEVAAVAGGELGPFAARDLALEASEELRDVHTDGGSSSFPKSCSVYGREAVTTTLGRLQALLQQRFGLEGSRGDLISAILAHPPEEIGEEPERGPFEVLPYPEVVRRVAARLQQTQFAERVKKSRDLDKEQQKLRFDKQVAAEKVSIWDKINIFTTTPEEAERNELAEELEHLGAELQNEAGIIDRLLDNSLATVYPPALLYYGIGGVLSAVHSIRAVCVSYTVTTGTGNNRRTETRYRCELRGKSAAQSGMRGWCAKLMSTFGELPTYAGLLERGELEKIGALARAAQREPDPGAR